MKKLMISNTQIVMGSADEDYNELKELAQNKETGRWSCLKETKKGDLLFIYFTKPHSAIVASATASGKARPGEDEGYYVVGIEDVKFFEKQITLEEIRREIPEWGWAKQARNQTYPKEPIANKLLKLAKLTGRSMAESPARTSPVGAGFGTAEQNRLVEHAARKAVRVHFEEQGYKVVSREKENPGYDLDVSGKGDTFHVEVKGTSGSLMRFPITNNEVECAKEDAKFRLALVTEATTASRQVHVFSQKEFLTDFTRTPIAYFAEMNRERVP